MPAVRPYKVHHDEDQKTRLVIASSPAQAIRYVSSGWKADPASSLEVAQLMGQGIACEDANAADAPQQPDPQQQLVEQQQPATVGA